MCGKKPKERKGYVLRMPDGTIVEVTREVYLEWYRSRRREKYQKEREQKYGVCSLNKLAEMGGKNNPAILKRNEPEEVVIKKLCLEKLKESLSILSDQDAYLIYLLFFEELTVKDTAQRLRCSHKTVQNRRKRILTQLKNTLKEYGTVGSF